jgi:hypothetical protein
MKLREFRLAELPPEEHAIGIYAGLALGAFVLGVGTLVLFRDMLITFKAEGLKINMVLVFRFLLMMVSAYAALACVFGLTRLIGLQRMLVRKVDQEFRDFVMYARPLVEEIIRQRIIGEKIIESFEKMGKSREIEWEKLRFEERPSAPSGFPRWGEFLLFVAILANVSVGLFLYSIEFPWQLVPYNVIILGILWWLVISKYFGLLTDIRSYYLPAIFILVMPSLSIIFRAYILPYQTIFLVFAIMFLYIVAMYIHFNYLVTGTLPEFFVAAPMKLKEVATSWRREVDRSVPPKLREYLPEKPPKMEEEGINPVDLVKCAINRIKEKLKR